MKPHKTIEYHCQVNGKTMPVIDWTETQFFVSLTPDGVRVLYLRKKSEKLLGEVVSNAMRRGIVLHYRNGSVTQLTWDTWQQTWNKIFVPKKRNKLPVPNTTRPYKSEMFEVMQSKRVNKKPQKHGFKRTESANNSMNILGHPLAGISIETI